MLTIGVCSSLTFNNIVQHKCMDFACLDVYANVIQFITALGVLVLERKNKIRLSSQNLNFCLFKLILCNLS